MYTSSASLPLSTRLGVWGFHLFAPSHRKPRSKKKQELPSSKQKQLEPAQQQQQQHMQHSNLPPLSPLPSSVLYRPTIFGPWLKITRPFIHFHPSTSAQTTSRYLATRRRADLASSTAQVLAAPKGTRTGRLSSSPSSPLSSLLSLLTPVSSPLSRLLSPGSLQFDVAMSFAARELEWADHAPEYMTRDGCIAHAVGL